MLALIDIGAEFWKNYFGSRSAVTGYELTLERIDWYRHVDCRTVVCCDSPKSLRKEWFEGYKANRPPKPAEALEALTAVQQRVVTWGLPVVQCDGYEADDLVATLASQAWPEEVHIIGSEKDFFCLIGDTVSLIGKHGPIGTNECFEKFGVLPCQMTDWLALVGDAAHGVHPLAGQGLNLAFRDVAALTEVVADAVRLGFEPGNAQALARYERWRRSENALMLGLTDTVLDFRGRVAGRRGPPTPST